MQGYPFGYPFWRQALWLRRWWQRLPAEIKQMIVGALAGGLVAAIGLRLAGW